MSTTPSTQEPISVKTYDEKDFVLTHKAFPGCTHIFEIKPKTEFKKSMYAAALKNVNKEVSVPGFRKGKAPEQYIKANFQKAIQGELQDLVINQAFGMSIELTKVQPRSREAVESVKADPLKVDVDSDIIIKFESFSEIPSIDTSKIKLVKESVPEITEEEIDKALHNVLLSHATWEDLPEKAIESGDWIVLDIEGTVEGETFQIAKDAKSQALKEQINQWIIDLILGKKAGDVVEGWNKQEEESEPNFQPTFCKITIKNVQKPILPELNAELAEKVRLPSIDDLRPRLKEALAHNKNEEHKEKQRKLVLAQIQENHVFDIPSSFVETELKQAVNQHIKKLRGLKLSDDELKAKAEQFEAEERTKIQNSYRLLMLGKRFAKEHDIVVSQQEVIGEMINLIQQNPENLRQFEGMSEEAIARIKESIHTEKMLTKVLDHIVDHLG